MPLLRRSQCAFYRQTCFFCYVIFKTRWALSGRKSWLRKLRKKKEENHILSCCVSITETTGAISAILKDKINQLSSLGQLSHNGTHHQIKTTIWNRYLWADLLPMPLARWDCFPAWPRRTNEIAFISQAWYSLRRGEILDSTTCLENTNLRSLRRHINSSMTSDTERKRWELCIQPASWLSHADRLCCCLSQTENDFCLCADHPEAAKEDEEEWEEEGETAVPSEEDGESELQPDGHNKLPPTSFR